MGKLPLELWVNGTLANGTQRRKNLPYQSCLILSHAQIVYPRPCQDLKGGRAHVGFGSPFTNLQPVAQLETISLAWLKPWWKSEPLDTHFQQHPSPSPPPGPPLPPFGQRRPRRATRQGWHGPVSFWYTLQLVWRLAAPFLILLDPKLCSTAWSQPHAT